MTGKYTLILLALAWTMFSCNSEDAVSPGGNLPVGGIGSSWDILEDDIFDGGPGKDGIPALESPQLISVSAVTYLDDEDLVLGYKNGEEVRAYPHPILDWHEIINDKVDRHSFAITYCPLTGTGIGWDRVFDGKETTFGVSGLLYNNNLIAYDRLTDSNWSQMRLDCVNGELRGTEAETFALVETTWGTWKSLYPNSKVVSTETGHSRNYNRYPYGDYKTNHRNIIFPVSPFNASLQAKERVHGIIEGRITRAFRFSSFDNTDGIIQDNIDGTPVVVATDATRSYIVSFERTLADGTLLSFRKPPVTGGAAGDVILEDSEGNSWNIFGEAVAGPRAGQKLEATTSFMGYWFAWGAFYPGIEIYDEGS